MWIVVLIRSCGRKAVDLYYFSNPKKWSFSRWITIEKNKTGVVDNNGVDCATTIMVISLGAHLRPWILKNLAQARHFASIVRESHMCLLSSTDNEILFWKFTVNSVSKRSLRHSIFIVGQILNSNNSNIIVVNSFLCDIWTSEENSKHLNQYESTSYEYNE